MRWVFLVLAACHAVPEPTRNPQMTDPMGPPIGEAYYTPPAHTAEAPVDTSGVAEADCKLRSERILTARQTLELSKKHDAEYFAAHCTPTMHYQTAATGGREASGAPDRAWICDGRVVQDWESVETSKAAFRLGMLLQGYKERCADGGS